MYLNWIFQTPVGCSGLQNAWETHRCMGFACEYGYSYRVAKQSMKPDSSVRRTTRFLDQVRDVIRGKHYSARTEQAYLYWARLYVRWQGGAGL